MPLANAMSGPPPVRHAQVLGGCSAVISSVPGNRRGPSRRVTTALESTASGPGPSWRTDTTLACHSGKREGVGRVGEDVFGTTGDLDAPYDCGHFVSLCRRGVETFKALLVDPAELNCPLVQGLFECGQR
jgi:hypothetical protein